MSQITRMPNEDLHIDFRKAEVADTVRLLFVVWEMSHAIVT